MARTFLAALAALVAAAFARPAAAQAIAQDIPVPGGGSERVLFASQGSPRAILVMNSGGDGVVEVTGSGTLAHASNFLMRTENLWLGQGFAFVALGSSSSLLGRRSTPAYAATIARAIDFARTRANVPVWLVGTSMGSIAAANGAAHLPGRVAGVVLTSSVVAPSRRVNDTVFDSDLGAIAVPALIVANRGDTCASAGPGFAPQILAALTRSPRKEIIYVESHQLQSDPCEPFSPHGYLGIEADVVQRIADWIRATPAR